MSDIRTHFELVSNVPEIPVEFRSVDSKYKRAFILFDTGASMTAISKDIVRSIDHSTISGQSTEISGFGGKKSAGYAILSDLVIGGVHLGPVTTLVYVYQYYCEFLFAPVSNRIKRLVFGVVTPKLSRYLWNIGHKLKMCPYITHIVKPPRVFPLSPT